MGFEDYISEIEAASFTGVSPTTLNRFAEAGYFQIESDSDGLRLFSKRDLAKVFGIKGAAEVTTVEVQLSSNISREERIAAAQEASRKNAQAIPPSTPDVREEPAGVTEEPAVFEKIVVEMSGSRDDGEVAATTQPKESAPAEHLKTAETINAVAYARLEEEVSKLRKVIALQDKLLDAREADIADLKQERDWLRERVEKQEEKSDRDQLLLLSEIQMASTLIRHQAEKKSPLRTALEWLGFAPTTNLPVPQPTLTTTFETKKDTAQAA